MASWCKPGLRVRWRDSKAEGVVEWVSFEGHVSVRWDDGLAETYKRDEATANILLANPTTKKG